MFAVIYRAYLKAGREDEYQQSWRCIAAYFVKHRGAIGSSLHKTEEGYWLAYSQWPDKATRDASWCSHSAPLPNLPNNIQDAILKLRDCIDQDKRFPEIGMEVVAKIC